jgi:hypothetical protein
MMIPSFGGFPIAGQERAQGLSFVGLTRHEFPHPPSLRSGDLSQRARCGVAVINSLSPLGEGRW